MGSSPHPVFVGPAPAGPAWCVDAGALEELARVEGPRYRNAEPFPHVVLDDLFPPDLLGGILEEFPAAGDPGWERLDTPGQRKLQWAEPALLPPVTTHLFDLLESAPFLDFVEQLTGISGLLVDPRHAFGGLHQIEPGGYLKIHSDITLHNHLWLDRRLSLIIYLNRDWDDSWGGDLQLWDEAVTAARQTIQPKFNRTVIFDASSRSHHGHPDPLASPPGVTRRSLGMYFYTSPGNPDRPRVRGIGSYRARPGELLPGDRWVLLRTFVADVLPPDVRRHIRKLRRRSYRGD